MVAGTFSPSITGFLGASMLTSNSGFLYSSTRNELAPTLGMKTMINPERRVRGQLERTIESAELVGHESLGEDLFALGILDLDRETLAREFAGTRLVIASAADPELEPDGTAGTVNRPVGDGIGLDLIVGRINEPAEPDVRESEVSEPPLGCPGGDEPLIVSPGVGQLRQRNENLAVVVGPGLQGLRLDAVLVLAVHVEHAPAEEFDVGLGNRLAGA